MDMELRYFWHDLLPGICLVVFGAIVMIFCRQIFEGMSKLAHKIFGNEADGYFGGHSNPRSFFIVGLSATIFGLALPLIPLFSRH